MAVYSDVIAEVRQERGLKQIDVARHFGLAQSTYSMYETGVRRMSVEMLVELAYLLDVSVDYLLGISSEPKPLARKKSNPYHDQQTGN